MIQAPSAVLAFWFAPANAERWFVADAAFDAAIEERFAATVAAASAGDLHAWTATPDGWLALVIVLDQFRRNLHRADARAFACDDYALRLALVGIERGDDLRLPLIRRVFAYMPLEHAEDAAMQTRSVELFAAAHAAADAALQPHMAGFLDFAQRHRQVIARFGRFPHRNAALGRPSTPTEQAYLAQPGAGF